MESPVPSIVELGDFIAIDPEVPIEDESSLDCFVLMRNYLNASELAAKNDEKIKASAYNMLGAVCMLELRRNEPVNSFVPFMRWSTGSSVMAKDFSFKQSAIFGDLAALLIHPALKARLADLAWVNTRDHKAAGVAIDAYVECVERLITKEAKSGSTPDETRNAQIIKSLERACVLQRLLGWKGDRTSTLIRLTKKIRQRARKQRKFADFLSAIQIEIEFGTTKPLYLAKALEALALSLSSEADVPVERFWQLAATAYSSAKDKSRAERAIVNLAEMYVITADRMSKSPMHAAHWLEKAIATLRKVKGTNARRAELQSRLVRAQGDIADFIVPMTSSTDISDLVTQTTAQIGGKDLASALLLYATPGSPSVAALRSRAEESYMRSPFGSLFSSIVYDETFKPVSRTKSFLSFGGRPEEADIRLQIMQHEQLRRDMETAAWIEPGRFQIMYDHRPDDRILTALAAMSPMVPPDHEGFFGRGFAHFFNADFIEAAHLLIPQLENSLRYILNAADVDTTRLKADLTQSNVTLSTLLDPGGQWRRPLEDLMGEAIVFEIENIFDHQAGPALRHRMAHGQLPQWVFRGRNAKYASWFIYRLCTIQLANHLDEVRSGLRFASL